MSKHVQRTIALAVTATLLSSSAAFASPVSSADVTSTPDTGTRDTTKSPTPKPGSSTSTTTTRKPADSRSEIDVPVDEQTKEFRDALAERQKRLDEFQAQLDELDAELEIATEEYNRAVDRLGKMKEQVNVAEGDLEKAKVAYELQTEILGTRAQSIYKDGSMASFEILLGAKSVADFIARVKFLNTIGSNDADIAASLKGQRELLESQVSQLQNAKSSAESLEFELKARQIEILLRIQERQQMLAEAQTDLLELLDSEAARRQVEESALLAEIMAGANEKGIVVTAGSPVETALAYHGVPYLWGGETPAGFDCSGLMLYVFAQHGVSLPHYSGSQFAMGEKVSPAGLLPGDAVFFGSPVHHVGMYMGGGYYIHAPRTGDFVKISKLAARNDYAGGRRYPWKYRTAAPKNAVNNTTRALQSTPQ